MGMYREVYGEEWFLNGPVMAIDAEDFAEIRRAFDDVEHGAGCVQLADVFDVNLPTILATLDGTVPCCDWAQL